MAKKQDEWKDPLQAEQWNSEDNAWYQKAQQTAEALLNREPFSYDPERDPLYQAAREQYIRQGRKAMEDTMGKAAALSGGYASSYAQTLGSQAYDAQLTRLAELLPDYYDRARSAYDKQGTALRDALGTVLGLYDKDYQAWLDRQEAAARQRAADTAEEHWEREFARDNSHWEAEFERDGAQWAAQQAASAAGTARSDAASERSYAYRMAMLALQQGLKVSDSLLRSAGIDKDYAETIRRYYYQLRQQ